MRVCIVYDCLYPWTVGGAERWYRALAERLAQDGDDVTYLTRRQWPRGQSACLPGVNVIAVCPRFALYERRGRRRVLPPAAFGLGVLWHLTRFGHEYDVVHTASFPYFSVLAIALVRRFRRFGLVIDWFEFWTREYWSRYLGSIAGALGWWVQHCCVRTAQRAVCFSSLTAERLRGAKVNGDITLLRGLYAGPGSGDTVPHEPSPAVMPPKVVFAGRHVPHKRLPALVAAVGLARRQVPDLTLELFGEGPGIPALEEFPSGMVVHHGVVEAKALEEALRSALCVAVTSSREGYGLLVVEGAAVGCPSVVVDHPDNASTELVTGGVNGWVAPSADPAHLAEALLRVFESGQELRRSTARWYAANAFELSLGASAERIRSIYERARKVGR